MTHLLEKARLLSTAFGLVMATAAAMESGGVTFVLGVLAALSVLVGVGFRPAATLAVLLAAVEMLLTDTRPLVAGLAGLSAAGYLVLRHAEQELSRPSALRLPTAIAALGFGAVGVLAAGFPFSLPWLPLLAPPAVFGVYVLATRPFFAVAMQDKHSRRTVRSSTGNSK